MSLKPLNLDDIHLDSDDSISSPIDSSIDNPFGNIVVDGKDNEKDKDKKKKTSIWLRLFNTKKFKLPNRIAVIYLRNNGKAQPIEVESNQGFFHISGKTYHEDRDCVFQLEVGNDRIPLAIIPEWSLIPYGTKKWQEEPMLAKFHSLEDHVLRGIKNAEMVRMGEKSPMKLNAKAIIGIIIVVIIGVALLMNYL